MLVDVSSPERGLCVRSCRKLLVCACLLACIVLCLATTIGFCDNLLVNPGFESDVAYWNQVYGAEGDACGWHWKAASNSSGFWNGAVTAWGGGTQVRTGAYCVRVFHYGPVYGYPDGWRTSDISQLVDVNHDADYTASAWVFIYLAPGANIGTGFNAGLVVEELDAQGNLLTSHQQLLTDAAETWREISFPFHTLPGTAQVRYILTQHWLGTESVNHINWDDCALDGSPSTARIVQGTVASGASALGAAAVTVNGNSVTTDAHGAYKFGVSQDTDTVVVRAAVLGYYAQTKTRTLVDGPNILDFDLVAKGDNLVSNAGFDDDAYAGGWVEEDRGKGYRRGESEFILGTGLTPYYHSGENAICLFTIGSPGGFWYYQDIAVVGGQQYTAGVRTKVSMASGATTKWGNRTDAQVAGLLIKEYSSSGALVYAHPLLVSGEAATWEQLSKTFTMRPTTNVVRIGPYVWSLEDASTNNWWRRMTFDDVELRGPVGQYGLSGTVTCAAVPVANAVVTVSELDGQERTCTTDASGNYTAVVNYGARCVVRVSKAGYVPQARDTTVTCSRRVDFSLTAIGANLLFNPSFDEQGGLLSGGWQTEGDASVLDETSNAPYGATCIDTFPQSVLIRGPGGWARVHQDVGALPNSTYTASCRFRAGTDPRYGSVWGTDPNQIGALYLQEYDSSMQPIGTERRAAAQVTVANRDQWQTLTLSLVTSSRTAYVRVGGYAYLVDDYGVNLARAIFDTFYLGGPPAPGVRVALARGLADGTPARLTGKVTTVDCGGFFYIEEPDRTSGIRVIGKAGAGELIDVLGYATTVDGERAIVATSLIRRSAAPVPRSLAMPIRSVRKGLSPVGLYVTLFGNVVDRRTGYYLLDDGSGTSLKVYGNASLGDTVRVTGALGAEMSGAASVPVLRAVQTTTVDTGGPGSGGPALGAGLLMDQVCRDQANADGRNYWWAYSSEILDRLGLHADIVSTDQLSAKLPELSVLLMGALEEERLNQSQLMALDTWVQSGGVLIACGTWNMDQMMGNQLVSFDPRLGRDFEVSSEFYLLDTAFTSGVQTPLHPDSPLVSVGPVRRVRSLNSTPLAQNGSDALITARKYGLGWAFYFGFDLAQTFWTIQQGRPVDADYDGDGYWRSGDAQILGNYEPEVPYTDELLIVLRNMVAVKPIPLLDQLPSTNNTIPDALFFYGGDDECGTGIQVPASDFMASRGLPYHINCMPLNGAFGLSLEDASACYANATELSVHYNFIDGFTHPGGFGCADVLYQTGLFRNYFGYTPISAVDHWTRWTGWAEPAQWMMQAGLKGDNSHFPVPLVTANPTNCFGFGFGTAFPYFFWGDQTMGNQRLEFVEMPISGYEIGYSGDTLVSSQIERALYTARYYHLTFNFFYHPVFIAYYQGCRDAIDTLLDLVHQQGLNVVHTTPDGLTLWWMDRSRISVSNVEFGSTQMSFDVTNPTTRSCIVRIPLGNQQAVGVSYPHSESDEFGVRWLKMVLPAGSQHVQLGLQAAE